MSDLKRKRRKRLEEKFGWTSPDQFTIRPMTKEEKVLAKKMRRELELIPVIVIPWDIPLGELKR